MAWSSSGGVLTHYVLPVSWMTSHLAAVGRMSVHALSLAKYMYSAPRSVARPGRSLMSMNVLLFEMVERHLSLAPRLKYHDDTIQELQELSSV